MLIVSFLVIVIGGLGSIAGAFVAAIIVGIVDTLGRSRFRNGSATPPGPRSPPWQAMP